MEDAIEDVLKTIGWDTGFRLPIANEENQKLERELAHLVIKKSTMTKEFEDANARVHNLNEHLKYVRLEVQQNQNLLSNYVQQLENEKHKLKLRQAEKDNTNAEIRRMAKKSADIQERINSKKSLLGRNLTRLEKMKTEAEWDNEAMKAWEESIKRRDEDNELLRKFSNEDRRKAFELETKRKTLHAELIERRGILSKMDVDIINYEQVLLRTGTLLKELKEERQALVRQWQESVKNMHQKDADIKRWARNTQTIQESIQVKREETEEQEAFLANEKSANKYLQMEIDEINYNLQRIRKEYSRTCSDNLLLQREQERTKKRLQRTAHEMNAVMLQLKEEKNLFEHFNTRLAQLNKDIAYITSEKLRIEHHSTDAMRNADLMDDYIKEAEKAGQLLTRQMQTLLNKQYKMNCATTELQDVGNLQRAEVCALENALGQIRKRSAYANQMLIHKKQLVSDLEMKVACLEAQIGNTDPDDMQDFEEMWRIKIGELEESLAQHTEIKNLLHVQILKLQKENLRLVNSISNDSKSQQVLKDKLQSLVLQIEGGIKQTKAATTRTQQKQVTENVLQLKVDKLNKAMTHADKEIYHMQRYKIDLESTLKERHIEVNIAKDVLMAKKKNLEEDRGRLRADISTRNVKIQQLEKKYELSLGLLGKDETGEPMSIATFKIKAAQERYQLQQEGDELDKKIRRTESEIVAMENTLKIVNMTNNSFKNSLTFVDNDSKDAELMKELTDQLTTKSCLLKEKKQKLFDIVDHHKGLTGEFKEYEAKKQEIQEELRKLADIFEKMETEEMDRKEKINRATQQILKCKKKIDAAHLEKYDRELYIRQLQDTNKNIMYQLADMSQQHPDVTPIMNRYFASNKLDLPKVRSSISSTSSDSIRTPSSLSSSSSTNKINVAEKPCCLANVTSLELKFDATSLSPQPSGSASKDKNKKAKK